MTRLSYIFVLILISQITHFSTVFGADTVTHPTVFSRLAAQMGQPLPESLQVRLARVTAQSAQSTQSSQPAGVVSDPFVMPATVEEPVSEEIPVAIPEEIPMDIPEMLPNPIPSEIPSELPAEFTAPTPETPEVILEPNLEPNPNLNPNLNPPATSLPAVVEVPEVPELALGTGLPGDPHLEGEQSHQLSIVKIAPAEIQVGTPCTWTIHVKNSGASDVYGVEVRDTIPRGTRLLNTHPTAVQLEDGTLTWTLDRLPKTSQVVMQVELMPLEEGELGSVASVVCRSDSSAKTVATRPMLKVETVGKPKVLLGEVAELTIVVSNPGSGIARNVVLSETVPPEMQFEGGAEILYKVGDLKPGESQSVQLPMKAVRKGAFTNRILAKSGETLAEESAFEMEVVAPELTIALDGPARRFLDKEGTFKLTLRNVGSASATNIEIRSELPAGWQLLKAEHGRFVEENRTILWNLESLDSSDAVEAEFTATPTSIGTHTLKCDCDADGLMPVSASKTVKVEGIAALMFQVTDSNDPIQVGESTTYTVRVVNQGSKSAENVQVRVTVPAGLQMTKSAEATQTVGSEQVFATIPSLAPKAEKVYTFVLVGRTSGDQRIIVKLSSSEFQTPIIKEESTRVYSE